MTTEHVDLNRFIVDRLDAAYRWIERLSEGITDEQFFYRPTDDTNSIAWLVWHLSRWRDLPESILVPKYKPTASFSIRNRQVFNFLLQLLRRTRHDLTFLL